MPLNVSLLSVIELSAMVVLNCINYYNYYLLSSITFEKCLFSFN